MITIILRLVQITIHLPFWHRRNVFSSNKHIWIKKVEWIRRCWTLEPTFVVNISICSMQLMHKQFKRHVRYVEKSITCNCRTAGISWYHNFGIVLKILGSHVTELTKLVFNDVTNSCLSPNPPSSLFRSRLG